MLSGYFDVFYFHQREGLPMAVFSPIPFSAFILENEDFFVSPLAYDGAFYLAIVQQWLADTYAIFVRRQ